MKHRVMIKISIDHGCASRSELRNGNEFVFGKVSNSEYFVQVVKCKYQVYPTEKTIRIIDLVAFTNNLYNPVEVYRLDFHSSSFHKALASFFPGCWKIKHCDDDDDNDLTRKIFNDLNYPHPLVQILGQDVIAKIHSMNNEWEIQGETKKYDMEEMKRLWSACETSSTDFDAIAIWFGHDTAYNIFDL